MKRLLRLTRRQRHFAGSQACLLGVEQSAVLDGQLRTLEGRLAPVAQVGPAGPSRSAASPVPAGGDGISREDPHLVTVHDRALEDADHQQNRSDAATAVDSPQAVS